MKPGRLIAGVLVLVMLIAAGVIYWRWFVRPLPVNDRTVFIVEPGQPLAATAANLERRAVLHKGWDLTWLARIEGQTGKIRAGEYSVAPEATTATLLDKLVSGNIVRHTLTVIDGWTFDRLKRRVANNPYIKHTLKGLSDTEIMARLGHADQNPEGRFFPETYTFARGTTDVAFLQRAYKLMTKHLQRAWRNRNPAMSLNSPYKSLILASIVEKESAAPAELERIAGVFVRRLRIGMRLQSDPTVIYGLGEHYQGNVTRQDLRTDTPYNTYTRSGLPPTPISLPGANAIRAVMHPARGNALYFVSKGDGTHAFSATLAEHRKAVRKYQLNGS